MGLAECRALNLSDLPKATMARLDTSDPIPSLRSNYLRFMDFSAFKKLPHATLVNAPLYPLWASKAMEVSRLPLSPHFQQCLDKFQNDLGPEMKENFKSTTLFELKRLILSIQKRQMESRRMIDLRRIDPFLKAMEQFENVFQALFSTDLLDFVWVRISFVTYYWHTYRRFSCGRTTTYIRCKMLS